ncbi:hypothetical protein NMY22_g2356 [Coprinellus aureogranulatus]|nr:hypothetical protein NMY22_g2356 [Coprinellus aureogranulatus]
MCGAISPALVADNNEKPAAASWASPKRHLRFIYKSPYNYGQRKARQQRVTTPSPHPACPNMSLPLRPQDLAALAFATSVFLYLRIRSRRSQHPLPPSPKGWLPILGHALQIPTRNCWTTFERWGKELGTYSSTPYSLIEGTKLTTPRLPADSDMVHLEALGKHFMVVNSFEIAKDLLESPRRSLTYSDRPVSTMVNDLMGYDWTMATLPYNAKWKGQRRLFSKYFSPGNPSAYQPQIKENVHLLLLKLLNNPEDFIAHIQHMVGSTVISLAYSIKTQPVNDPNLKLGLDSVNTILDAFVPGRYLVDTIAALKYLPEWLPGTAFLQDGKRGRHTMTRILEEPFAEAEKLIAEGNASPSLASMVLDDVREMKDREEAESTIRQCKEVGAVFFGAGYDTTQATLSTSSLPWARPTARVFRSGKHAISQGCNEGASKASVSPAPMHPPGAYALNYRWRQVNTIGVPHLSTQDDIYNGYFIPKNTLIIVNQRALLYDPEIYPEPDRFMPERFLSQDGKTHDPSVRDPQTIVFGFGRRACPGSHIALADLFMVAASILATFELSKAKDEHGNVIEPSVDLEASSLICGINPLPFKCCIKPRSKKAEEQILATAAQYDA